MNQLHSFLCIDEPLLLVHYKKEHYLLSKQCFKLSPPKENRVELFSMIVTWWVNQTAPSYPAGYVNHSRNQCECR